jgi:MFS transporter, DHA1 family, multidrug resistance protein
MAKAIDAKARLIGAASGMFGFAQMVVAAIVASLATMGQNLVVTSTAVMLGSTLLAHGCLRLAHRRCGRL